MSRKKINIAPRISEEDKELFKERVNLIEKYSKNPNGYFTNKEPYLIPFWEPGYEHPTPQAVEQLFCRFALRYKINSREAMKEFIARRCGVNTRTVERWLVSNDSPADRSLESSINRATWRHFIVHAAYSPLI